MPTIKKMIHTASRFYTCDICKGTIRKGDKYCRMFGMAFKGEKPYEVFECSNCHKERISIKNKIDEKVEC
jgi:hypothetical protein